MENFSPFPGSGYLFFIYCLFDNCHTYLVLGIVWFSPAPPSTYSQEDTSFFVELKNGDSVACLHEGNKAQPKRTVIFSHGNGEDLGNLKSFFSYFGSEGTEMIGYDYPGYGLSDGKASEQGCFDAIDAIYDHVINKLHREPGKIILWGRSLGTGPSLYLRCTKENWWSYFRNSFSFCFSFCNWIYYASVGSVQECRLY